MSKNQIISGDFNRYITTAIELLNFQLFDEILKLFPPDYKFRIHYITNLIKNNEIIRT